MKAPPGPATRTACPAGQRHNGRRPVQRTGGCQPGDPLPRLHCARGQLVRWDGHPTIRVSQLRSSTLADLPWARTSTPPSVVGRLAKGASAFPIKRSRSARSGAATGKTSPRSSIRPAEEVRASTRRCNVEAPSIAVATDEQIEYRGLRCHCGERSIRAGVLSPEAGWIDALQSGGRTCGPSSRRVPNGAWGSPPLLKAYFLPRRLRHRRSSRRPSSSCAF